MALSARDLYFAVRVEDRASRPLRRIAADFRALGKAGLAARQRDVASAKLAQDRAAASTRAAQAELTSLQTGSKRLALDLASAKAVTATHSARLKEVGLLNKARAQQDAIQRAASRAARIEAAVAAGPASRPFKATFGGLNASQVRNMRGEAQAAMETARRNFNLTAQAAGLSGKAVENAILKEKQLIAVEAERIAREAELRQIILSRAEAERLATLNVQQAIATEKRFPIDRIKGAGRIISHIGRGLAVVGSIGALSLGFMAKAAADFNTQITIAATQSTSFGNNTAKQVQKNTKFIQAEIQKLLSGGQVIAQPQEQADAIYQIFSGITIPGTQQQQLRTGIQLLKEFNKVATANAGMVTLEEATRAGIVLINDFGIAAADVPAKLNVMQAGVRFGALTMSQFVTAMNQAAPAAKAAGFSIEQMTAGIVFASRKFPSLRMGVAGFARLTETFANKKIVDGLKAIGIEITKTQMIAGVPVKRLLPIEEIVQRITKARPELKSGGVLLQNFFKEVGGLQSTVQARRFFTFLAQDVKGYKRNLRDVIRDHNELDKSLRAAQAAPGVRWTEFTLQLRALALEIGTGVIPAVGDLADQVRGLANWFNNLSPHTKQTIGSFAIWIAVATVLMGILAIMVGSIMQLTFAAKALASAFGLMGGEAGLTLVQFSLLLGVIGAAVLIFYKYPPALDAVVNALGGMKAAIETVIALLIAQKFGLFASVIAEATAATGAVTTLSMALATLGAIGTVVVTIIVLRKLIDAPGSPIHGLAPETQSFLGDLKKTFKDPLDLHAQVKVFADVGHVLWTHDPNKQIEQDLRDKIDSLGTIKVTSGRRGLIEMDRQFDVKIPDVNALQKSAEKAARAMGVDPTPQFKQLFIEYVKASRALDQLKASHAGAMKLFEAETRKGLAADALKAYSKAALKAAEDAAKADKVYSDATIIAEAKKVQKLEKFAENRKTYAAWKAYYAALKQLQDHASDEQLSAAQQIYDTTATKAKQSADKIKDIYKDVFSNLKSQYDTFLQQNQSAFGQLFQGPWMQSALVKNRLEWGQVLNTGDLLKDLRQQVSAFRKWRADIEKARRRGLPQSLLDQIMALGPDEGRKQLELINKMTPKQLAEYKRLWLAGQRDIQKATERDLQNQLKIWQRQGRRIALAIARGLRDENAALENALKDMILKAFPSLTKGAPKDGPVVRPAPHTGSSTPKHRRSERQRQEEAFRKQEINHYHVTTTADPKDVKKQLKDANFHHRVGKK